ncbi:hypothetical protein F8M41_012591 [Gigaspora margarita]|uniref:Uncharacterized protein n=1 Tax=Gigaspora margarita TaxID=4874 RepID=A0A8H3WZQ0_GIGMA|nr:hypothetical protein F8M41_012591 [Gigaspora margarita]
MFKQDIKTITQDNVNKEVKSFVREFEVCSRSSFYDYCVFILPNHLEYFSQIEITENMQDRKQFMDNQNQANQEFDNEFKEREQKLIKEYRTMIEEALRGVYDPSASVTSNITSESSSKHND